MQRIYIVHEGIPRLLVENNAHLLKKIQVKLKEPRIASVCSARSPAWRDPSHPILGNDSRQPRARFPPTIAGIRPAAALMHSAALDRTSKLTLRPHSSRGYAPDEPEVLEPGRAGLSPELPRPATPRQGLVSPRSHWHPGIPHAPSTWPRHFPNARPSNRWMSMGCPPTADAGIGRPVVCQAPPGEGGRAARPLTTPLAAVESPLIRLAILRGSIWPCPVFRESAAR